MLKSIFIVDMLRKCINFFRLLEWIHLLGLAVLGYTYASRISIFSALFLLSLFTSVLYLAHGYSFNVCFDNRFGDIVVVSKNNSIAFKKAILISYFVFIINIILSSSYSLQVTLLVTLGGFLSFLYSFSHIRFKKIPFLGLFCNSLGFTFLFLIGYAAVKNLDLEAFLMAVFIFILFLPIDLAHQLNDMEEDLGKSFKTTAIACGIKKTLNLITLSLVILNIWILAICFHQKKSYYFFSLTLLFTVSFFLFLFRRFSMYGYDISKYKIKLNLRYLTIIYGLGLFIIFYFKF